MTITSVQKALQLYTQLSEKKLLDKPTDIFLRMTKEGGLSCEKRGLSCWINRVIAFFSKKNSARSEYDFVRNLEEFKDLISRAIYEVRESGTEFSLKDIEHLEEMVNIYNKILMSVDSDKTGSRLEKYKIKHSIQDKSSSIVAIHEIAASSIASQQVFKYLESIAKSELEKKALVLLSLSLAAKNPEVVRNFTEFSKLYDNFIKQVDVLSKEKMDQIKKEIFEQFLREITTSESLQSALTNANRKLNIELEEVKSVVAKVFEEKKDRLQGVQKEFQMLREEQSRQKIEIEKPFSNAFLFEAFNETLKIDENPSIEGIHAINKKIAEIEIHIACENKKKKLLKSIFELVEVEDSIQKKGVVAKEKGFSIEVNEKVVKPIVLAVAQEISGDFDQTKEKKLDGQISFINELVIDEKKRFSDLDEKIDCLERMNGAVEQQIELLSEWDKSSASQFIQEGKQKLLELSTKIKQYKEEDLSALVRKTKDIVETYSDQNVQKAIKEALEEENRKTLSSLEADLDLERKKGAFSGVVSWFSGKAISDQEYAIVDLFAKASSSVFWNNILHCRSGDAFDGDASLRAEILRLIAVCENKFDLPSVKEILAKFRGLEEKNIQLQLSLEILKKKEFFDICSKKNVMEKICGDIKFINMLIQKDKWPDKDKQHLSNFLEEKKRLDGLSEGIKELNLTEQEGRWKIYLEQLFTSRDLKTLHESGIDRYKDIEQIKELAKVDF